MPESLFLIGKKHTNNNSGSTHSFSVEDTASNLSQTKLRVRVINSLTVLHSHVNTITAST